MGTPRTRSTACVAFSSSRYQLQHNRASSLDIMLIWGLSGPIIDWFPVLLYCFEVGKTSGVDLILFELKTVNSINSLRSINSTKMGNNMPFSCPSKRWNWRGHPDFDAGWGGSVWQADSQKTSDPWCRSNGSLWKRESSSARPVQRDGLFRFTMSWKLPHQLTSSFS